MMQYNVNIYVAISLYTGLICLVATYTCTCIYSYTSQEVISSRLDSRQMLILIDLLNKAAYADIAS